jgi:hypothetical protein
MITVEVVTVEQLTASDQLIVTAVFGRILIDPFAGDEEISVGEVLSTENAVLLPDAGAGLPAMSLAVPAPIVIASVPSPVIPLIVTVRVLPAPASTPTVPFAVPEVFSVMSPEAKLLALK